MYPLKKTVEQACTGEKLICIVGGFEGKSTLHACHFCKLAGVRCQDRGVMIRSLSYQLAIRHPAFAQALLNMSPFAGGVPLRLDDGFQAASRDPPLRAARSLRATILIDALDESGGDGQMISLLNHRQRG